MNDLKRRLMRCFAAAFDDLSEEQLATAHVDSVPAWDSIATVTLASLVEEEFALHIAPADIVRLTSFDAFYRYLEAGSLAA